MKIGTHILEGKFGFRTICNVGALEQVPVVGTVLVFILIKGEGCTREV